ncbi:DUF4142 domain-containing protein [Pontibacter sp. H259]|uniref:DUF4142 domain-containing protein n=1 Tax=Pontibacter sp. H259 TaxID=3133421 RepID=UPI0030BABA09
MFLNKHFILAFAVVSLFLSACDTRTIESETNEITYTLDRNEPSAMFWDYAASTSMLQTELSKLASQKTTDTQLLALADSSYLHHAQALRKLKRIAEKYKQVQLPDSLTGADKTIIADFTALEGEEFKTKYLDYLKSSQRSQIDRYQETLNETEDPALREWLQHMTTYLQNQLRYYAAADSVSEEE